MLDFLVCWLVHTVRAGCSEVPSGRLSRADSSHLPVTNLAEESVQRRITPRAPSTSTGNIDRGPHREAVTSLNGME